MGAQPGDAAADAARRPPSRPTRRRRPPRSPRRPSGATIGNGRPRPSPAPRPTPAAASWPPSRSRSTAARPGTGPPAPPPGPTRGSLERHRARSRSWPAPSTTAATSRPRRPAAPVNVDLPLLDLRARRRRRSPRRAATPRPVEVGVKFTSQDSNGWITGVRFYKGAGNTGTHIGNLWTSTRPAAGVGHLHQRDGERVAAGRLRASRPGHRRDDLRRLVLRAQRQLRGRQPRRRLLQRDEGLDKGAGAGPLQALADGTSGGNGVYRYGGDGFPTATFGADNYWVDAVLATTLAARHQRRPWSRR